MERRTRSAGANRTTGRRLTRRILALIPVFVIGACADEPAAPTGAPASARALPASEPGITVVMWKLNSPRGLAFGPEGGLYVAEAGTTDVNGPCVPVIEGGAPVTKCYSGTGSISRLWKGRQERLASGLPSTFVVQSGFATGPNDISFLGRGMAYVPIGWGAAPASRSLMGEVGAELGTLVRLKPNGDWRVVADVAAFEGFVNPAGGPLDSNPYGVLTEGASRFVVDAGGNSLLEVAEGGEVSLVAIFPTTPAPPPFNSSEPVPTKVERGPDGALYVSTLTGAPFVAGAAAIYRVVPGEAPTVFVGGFKTITDFTFGPDGSLYVVQFATAPMFFNGPGALIRVAPSGARSTLTTALVRPTGVAVDRDGAIYVADNGTVPGAGRVLKIVLPL